MSQGLNKPQFIGHVGRGPESHGSQSGETVTGAGHYSHEAVCEPVRHQMLLVPRRRANSNYGNNHELFPLSSLDKCTLRTFRRLALLHTTIRRRTSNKPTGVVSFSSIFKLLNIRLGAGVE